MKLKCTALVLSALLISASSYGEGQKEQAGNTDKKTSNHSIRVYMPGGKTDPAVKKAREDYCASVGMVDVTDRGLLIGKGSAHNPIVCGDASELLEDDAPFDINDIDPAVLKSLIFGTDEDQKKHSLNLD